MESPFLEGFKGCVDVVLKAVLDLQLNSLMLEVFSNSMYTASPKCMLTTCNIKPDIYQAPSITNSLVMILELFKMTPRQGSATMKREISD